MLRQDTDGRHNTTSRQGPGEDVPIGDGSVYIYIAPDRPDAQFAIRGLAGWMSAPTELALVELKHCVRFLLSRRDFGVFLRRLERPADPYATKMIKVRTDSDWAQNKKTRKSTSCVHIFLRVGDWCLAVNVVRGQAVIALSVGEAEFYAAVSGVVESLFVRNLLQFFCVFAHIELASDSSTARAIMSREGIGKLRHMETRCL